VLRETTSRGLCGLVCPSRTSERGGEGDCVKVPEAGTNQTKPAQSVAKRVQSCSCEVCAVRRAMRSGCGGRCVAGWLSVRELFAMQCSARGLVAFARCAALYRMRCNALRCTGCDALRCTGCDARADALRAGCDAMRCAALHGVRIVCDAMRCARAGCIRAVQAAPCF
jgi:hypothetical protein